MHYAICLGLNFVLQPLNDSLGSYKISFWVNNAAWGIIGLRRTKSTLAKLVCNSSSVIRSSTLTTCCCIETVCSSLWSTTSERVATMGKESLAALVTNEFKTSYAAVRSWLSTSVLNIQLAPF